MLAGWPELRLRKREWQVLELLADGDSTQEIALKLSIAPATVRGHDCRLLAGLEVGNARRGSRFSAVGVGMTARAFNPDSYRSSLGFLVSGHTVEPLRQYPRIGPARWT